MDCYRVNLYKNNESIGKIIVKCGIFNVREVSTNKKINTVFDLDRNSYDEFILERELNKKNKVSKKEVVDYIVDTPSVIIKNNSKVMIKTRSVRK